MPVFRVTKPGTTSEGREKFMNWESHQVNSLDELVQKLNDGAIVMGDLLITRMIPGQQAWEIVSRKRIGLGRAGVAMVEYPDWPVVEMTSTKGQYVSPQKEKSP